MTRYFILSSFFLAAFTLGAVTNANAAGKAVKNSITENIDMGMATQTNAPQPASNTPALPGTQPVQKTHTQPPTMDELAHVHHFHKGRVKKMKKHHRKCWAMSKIILVLCHVAILLIAYLHVTH